MSDEKKFIAIMKIFEKEVFVNAEERFLSHADFLCNLLAFIIDTSIKEDLIGDKLKAVDVFARTCKAKLTGTRELEPGVH